MDRLARGCLTVLSILLLIGCGPAAEQASEEPSEGETVTVTLAYNRFLETSFTDAPPPIEMIQEAVATEHPNIEVQLNIVPDAIDAHRDALAIWMTSEDPTIDIYGMDSPWVLEFGSAGWAEPLNERLPELEENFVTSGLDVFTYEEQRLGVPFWGSVGGMFYRSDLLEEYGYAPPETYDELVEIATAITTEQPQLTGFVWPGAQEESLVQVWVEVFLGYGGQYTDATGACAVNSPEGIAAVEFLRGTIEEGVSPPETPAWTPEEARTRFVNGEAIFLRHNHDIVTWLDDPEQSQIAEKWGFMSNPAQANGQRSGATGGFAFAINPFTDSMEEATQVLAIIASEEVQQGFALAWGPVQYYEGLYDDPAVQAVNANVQLVEAVLPSAVVRPPSTNYAQLSDILQQEIHAALTGIKPVDEALNAACSRIDELE